MLDTICSPVERNDILYQWKTDEHLLRRNTFIGDCYNEFQERKDACLLYTSPKPNGYRSLHLTIRLPVFFAEKEIRVPVEIQLRTIAMDFWASLEHTIRYKKNLPINAEIETELKECADSSREWDGKMEHLLHILT